MTILNVYTIPVGGRSTTDYFDYVSGLDITFNAERNIQVDPSVGTVKVDGTIASLTPTGTEDTEAVV